MRFFRKIDFFERYLSHGDKFFKISLFRNSLELELTKEEMTSILGDQIHSPKIQSLTPWQSRQYPDTPSQRITVERSSEKIAKIVFAPVIDSNGNYHDSRVIYIVVEPSKWITKGDKHE